MEHPYRAPPAVRRVWQTVRWRRPPRPSFAWLGIVAFVGALVVAAGYAAWPAAKSSNDGACYEGCAAVYARCRDGCQKPWCMKTCAGLRDDCEVDCRPKR